MTNEKPSALKYKGKVYVMVSDSWASEELENFIILIFLAHWMTVIVMSFMQTYTKTIVTIIINKGG